MALRFHHLGLAVRDFAKASRFYANLGYRGGAPVVDPLQKVELLLLEAPGQPSVELIRPLGPDSPVARMLEKSSENLYHTCYQTDDLPAALAQIFAGVRYLRASEPKPAVLFGGQPVSFYYAAGVGLVEILETRA